MRRRYLASNLDRSNLESEEGDNIDSFCCCLAAPFEDDNDGCCLVEVAGS